MFDFDAVLFPDLWRNGTNMKDFKTYLRYYISDTDRCGCSFDLKVGIAAWSLVSFQPCPAVQACRRNRPVISEPV